MRINHNLASLNTYRQLQTNNSQSSKAIEKLSSGLRINRAGDDAAGLAISEKMRAQIRGLDMASKNSQDAISLIQTGEGALNETQSILQRMRELAVQAANDTNVTIDRDQIQKEMNQLTSEINRIGNTTEFNTMKLLNGDLDRSVGATEKVLSDGTKTVNYGEKVDVANSDTDMMKAIFENKIEVAAGDFGDSLISAGCSIEITKSSTGITVKLQGGTALGSTAFSATDNITADANGDYVYDDHGVSFTIKASALETISQGETLKLDNLTGVDTFGTLSDYDKSSSSAFVTLSDVTVTSDNDNKNIRSVQIQATTSELTVSLMDAYSGGNTIDTDILTYDAATNKYVYNAHGISFEVDYNPDGNTASQGTTLSALISLEDLGITENVLSYNDGALAFQVGANENQTMSLNISDMRAAALKISSAAGGGDYVSTVNVTDGTSSDNVEYALDVSTNKKAAKAITLINDAINAVSTERSKLGSVQNRLEHTINNLNTASENLTASESRIRDVDMAKEMMEFQKNNILSQAAQAMMAQANQQPQGVLQLLR